MDNKIDVIDEKVEEIKDDTKPLRTIKMRRINPPPRTSFEHTQKALELAQKFASGEFEDKDEA